MNRKKIIASWILIGVYAVLIGVLAKLYVDYGGFNAENDNSRHIAQIAFVGITVLSFLTLRRIYKLIPKEKVKRVLGKAKEAVRRVVLKVYRRIARLIGKLGLGGKKLARGEDEYSFVFDEKAKKQVRLSVGKVSRWDGLTDNSEKIRFLFIRYMLGRIRRGYRRRYGKTHMEWAKELGAKDEVYSFFEDYGAARYGRGAVEIPDSAVERARKIVDKKK